MNFANTFKILRSLSLASGARTVYLDWADFRKDSRGLAAIEFAFVASFLCIAVLNVTDVAVFLTDRMEVNEATEAGAQAAYATCDFSHLPATINCPGLNSAVTSAVQTTSLGASTSLQTGSPSEAYYCVTSSGAMQNVGSVSSPKPTDCTAAGSSTTKPGDYVLINTTYSFTPIFSGVSVGSLLPTTITGSAWVRLG